MQRDQVILDRIVEAGLGDIANLIAEKHGITVAEMFSDRKYVPLPTARAEFSAHLKQVKGWSYPQIGRLVGRDHTTIIDQVRRIGVAEIVEERAAGRVRLRVA